MSASFIYKSPEPIRRERNWFLLLISAFLISMLAAYLAGNYVTERFLLLSPVTDAFGIALIFSGLSITIWARITLGRFWSGSVAVIEGQPVVKEGPYSIIRHPIYTGVIMMLWGSFLLEPFGFVLLNAVFGTILLACKARFEERLLERCLGDKYSNYKKEVECSFIPG
ncbi:MAG: isoprenylcysteine carboxylmethyltransferase family protein [Deltaproteobacteria bacterium]|nr:isoprenylcysteine carboxylmethyltransferase family protein [Deltaproteobacteria bacterium]